MSVSSIVSALDSLDFTSALSQHMAGNMLWAYVLLALTTAPPLVPNSALLVTGGILAASGRLNISLVLLVVAGSALAGDLVIHRTGRAVSGRVRVRLYRRRKRGQLLEWAAARIQRYGIPFVIGCRFLPSGRVIGGLAAGIVRFPSRRFLIGASVAEALWATYSVGIGYLGGEATGNSLYAMGLGLGVSLAVATLGGLVQLAARRRHSQALSQAEPISADDTEGPAPSRTPAFEGPAPDVARS
ncbi:VTT domain-containing protein [Streptomyces sp. NPDC020096]